jgi:DNA-binding transcriptional regulator YdaS (Cro superfamily)
MTSNRDKLSWFHPDSLVRQLVLGYCDGNQAEAARRFNVSRQQMQLWVSRGFLPAARVFEAEKITGGQITAEQFMDEFIAKNVKADL